MLGECYVKMGLDYPLKSFRYDIQRDEEIQNYLSQVCPFCTDIVVIVTIQKVKSVTDDALFTLSFASEPNRGEEQPIAKLKSDKSFTNPLYNSSRLALLYKSKNMQPVKQRTATDPLTDIKALETLSPDISPNIKPRRSRREELLSIERQKFTRCTSDVDSRYTKSAITRRKSDRAREKTDTLVHNCAEDVLQAIEKFSKRSSTDEPEELIKIRTNGGGKRRTSLSARLRFSIGGNP